MEDMSEGRLFAGLANAWTLSAPVPLSVKDRR